MSALSFTGPQDAPVILVLGGISSTKHVTQWWKGFVGIGCPIDTVSYRIVGVEYSNAESTRGQAKFILDQLDRAGITDIHAVVGASYGGMVALALAELDSSRFERLIVISAAHESSASATVHRTLQRKVVELGFLAGLENDALALARGLATTTYSTPQRFSSRFSSIDPDERLDEIDKFLTLAGGRFAENMNPSKFLNISKSLDLHHIDPSRITTPTILIGVIEDSLVLPSQLDELAEAIGGSCDLVLISSIHGHDAFLDEQELIAPIVTSALEVLTGAAA